MVLKWCLVLSLSFQISCFAFLLSLFFHVNHAMMEALENETLRNPKPSLVDRSVLELSVDTLVPPDIYVDRALLRPKGGYDDVFEAAGPMRGQKLPWTDLPDSDTDLVAEAKARLQELQRETEIVEDAYKNYQQRAVHSSISNLLPQRPANPLHRPTSPLRKHISYHSPTLSPHKSKVPHTPLSPQITTIPSPGFYDTRDIALPAQPRVTFAEDHNEPQSTVFTDDGLYLPSKPLFVKDEHPPDRSNSPSKHLSSTLHSSPRKSLQRETLEGTIKDVSSCQNTTKQHIPQLFHVSTIHLIAFQII